MTWLVALVAGTPESTTRDADVDQVGPECMVRAISTVATTEHWTLTARAADGAGGYITASTTITLTITAPNDTRRFYWDSVGGNNANDGRDPWGFNVSGCTFTNSTKRLVKTGAFTAYDHTAATAPDKPYRYNYVGVVSGTGVTAGSYEIASKISNNEIELVADIGGTNPSNVVLSTGPKADGTGWGDFMASGDVMCFKGGGSWTLAGYPDGFNEFGGYSNIRAMRYGSSNATLVGQVSYNIPGSTNYTNNTLSGFTIDGNNVETINVLVAGSGSGTLSHLYFSNCTIQNGATGTSSSNFNYAEARCGDGFGWWKCTLARSNAGQHGILAGGQTTSWFFVMGCSISGDGSNAVLDHHIYPTFQYNGLFGWNNFGAATDRNYCINANTTLTGAAFAEYVSVVENNLSGTLRACDFSQTNNDYSISRFRKVVVDGNAINGLDGDGQFLFYCCDSMTFRDNIAWGNTGGRLFAPDGQQTSLNLKVYKNRAYTEQAATSALFELPDTLAAVLFRDNDIFDARSSATTYAVDIDFDGAAVDLDGNRFYIPNRSGNTLLNDGAAASFATYQTYDLRARSIDPEWTDATTGDLTPTYTFGAVTGVAKVYISNTGALIGWTDADTSENLQAFIRLGTAAATHTQMQGPGGSAFPKEMGELTNLLASTAYFFSVYATDGYDIAAGSAEQGFTTGAIEPVSSDRIYLTSGITEPGANVDVTNPDRVNGADSGDYANTNLNSNRSDILGGTIAPTVVAGTIVGWKIGITNSSAAAPHASAFQLLQVSSGGVVVAEAVSNPAPSTTKTEHEIILNTAAAGGIAAFTALVEAGFTGVTLGAPNGPNVTGYSLGGATDIRTSAVWLLPVLAELTGPTAAQKSAAVSVRGRGRGRMAMRSRF